MIQKATFGFMSKLRGIWKFVCRHKYIVAIIFFAVTVGYLAPSSFYHLYLQKQEISKIQSEINYYQGCYNKDTHTLKQLDATPHAMVKIARERYFMKKPNEDIYVIK